MIDLKLSDDLPDSQAELITYRQAGPDDLPGLVRIEQTCFAIPWSENSLRADLHNRQVAHYFLAESAGQGIVGYIACYQALDTVQITNLAVLPTHRRQGIGQELLSLLLVWAMQNQIATVDLEVRPSNEAARSLYRNFGFTEVGVRKAYYADNQEDAIIMLKNIL